MEDDFLFLNEKAYTMNETNNNEYNSSALFKSKNVFSHFSLWRQLWEHLMLFLGFSPLFELTFIGIFDLHITIQYYSLFFIIDILFVIDFFIFFRTEVFKGKAWITSPAAIIDYWGKSYYVVFIISLIPLGWIGILVRNVIVYYALSIIKLLRIKRGLNAIETLFHNFPYSGGLLSIVPIFVLFFYCCHVFTCIFMLTAVVEGFPNSWFAPYAQEGYTITDGYIITLYYVLVTVTTIGFGDITPKTTPEVCIAILIHFFGIPLYMSMVTVMYNIQIDPIKDSFDIHIGSMIDYLKFKKVNRSLIHECYNYAQQIYHETKGVGYMKQIMELIPTTYKNEVRVNMTRHFFYNTRIFMMLRTKMSDMISISNILNFIVYSPDDFLVSQGQKADRIIMIASGNTIQIQDDDICNSPPSPFVFGEQNILFDMNYEMSIKAITYVEAWEMRKEDFIELLNSKESVSIGFTKAIQRLYPAEFNRLMKTFLSEENLETAVRIIKENEEEKEIETIETVEMSDS